MKNTGNKLIDELLIKSTATRDPNIYSGSYKDINIKFTLDDYFSPEKNDYGCYVHLNGAPYPFRRRNYKEQDCVRIMYNYSYEETQFCMDMLCDVSIYHVKGKTGDAIIRCDGNIYVTKNIDYPVGFQFGDKSKCIELPSIIYLTKTRNAMIKIIDICESDEEFIEAYNIVMNSSTTKNARS